MVTDAEREAAIRQAVEWLASPDGQAEMRRRAEIVEEISRRLRATRDIPHELLHRPFTI